MPEVMIGPQGELELPPKPDAKRTPKEYKEWEAFIAGAIRLTGSWGTLERARNAALAYRDGRLRDVQRAMTRDGSIGPAERKLLLLGHAHIQRAAGTTRHNAGRHVGVESSDAAVIKHELRLDWDPPKGPHYNVCVGKNKDYTACFCFPAPPGYTLQQADAWIRKMQKIMLP